MSLLVGACERLVAFIAPEAQSLKVAEFRSVLILFLVLALTSILKRASFVKRLSEWLSQSQLDKTPQDSTPSVMPLAPTVPSNVEVVKAAFPTSALRAEASCKDADQILAGFGVAKTPLSSPQLTASSLCWENDCPDMPDGNPWLDDFKPLDSFDSMSGLEDLWSDTGDFLAGPQAAVTADANSVLETALASGDAKVADAALAAGVRLCSSSWLTKACGQIQAAGIPLMPERMLDLIRVYGHERRADLAVDLWEAHCIDLGLDPADGDECEPPPAADLYSAALEACARAGDFETAARAASSTGWRVPFCRHGQAAFLALARWYARRQDVAQALVCYQAVRAVTGNADLATHRAVLVASVRSADMAKADALFQDLMSSGITPDGASFSAMVCGHCSAGNVDKAMHYFRLLRERGIVPTAPLFDAILDGCAWMNMPALVEQVLADMEATGVRPSTTTLSILMRLHGMNRDTEQALALFDELPKKHGLKLDGHAYGSLISVCLKNDVYDMAWNAFERMIFADCVTHARIYESLIAASLRRGLLDNAVQVVNEALGLSKQQPDEAVMAPRMRLQSKTIEDVLNLIGRRRQAASLGAPMVEQLLAAGVELQETLVDAMFRSASKETELPCSELHRRRAQRLHWRNFSEADEAQLLTSSAGM